MHRSAHIPLRLLGWWHLLSFDAPTVALVWLSGFAWAARVKLPVWIPVVLFCGTWGVYLLDRILDAHAALKKSQSEKLQLRHQFHWRFKSILLPLGLSLVAFAFLLAVYEMPATARIRNSVLMLAALGYFWSVHAQAIGLSRIQFKGLKYCKEALVALIFTAACVLPVLARTQDFTFWIQQALLFALLAWLNCHAIDCWESQSPKGTRTVLLASLLLAVAALGAAFYMGHSDWRVAALDFTACASSLLIASLHFYRLKLTPLNLRIAADLVLLTPLLFLMRSALQ
jgi:Na+/H+ antiporter NhaC